MNSDTINGKWKQIRGEFKKKYGKLTNDNSAYADGEFDKVAGEVQEKYGKTREEFEEEVKNW